MKYIKNKIKGESLLKNLQFWEGSISTIEEGVQKLEGLEKDLETVHIYIELMSDSTFRKKEFYNISKLDRLTKLFGIIL